VDTTGAGDIFGGSAVSKILAFDIAPSELSTEQLKDIGSFASTAASLSTEKAGGIPSIPSIEAVNERRK
jgi:sugar/nucleoside kinase (ribokinase family)